MGAHVAERVVKLMLKQGIDLNHSRVLVLGLTFKENCPDLRNTRVIDIIRALGVPGASILYDVKSALPASQVDARL